MNRKIPCWEKLLLAALFCYAMSLWNLAGYLFAALSMGYLGCNLHRITIGIPEMLLMLFSSLYFLFFTLHNGLGWNPLVNFLWGPWASFLVGKVYVETTPGRNSLFRLFAALGGGFFMHGILNWWTYLGSDSYALAYGYQRISIDVWQGTVAGVTTNGMLFSFGAGMSVGVLLSRGAKAEKWMALGVLLACLGITVFYANRTLLYLVAVLVVWQGILFGPVTTRRKLLLLAGALAAVFALFFMGNWGGFRNWLLGLKLTQRLAGEDNTSRFRAWGYFFRDMGFLRHPIGGGYLTAGAPTPYLHNLWLDVYNAAGALPFLALLGFTVWAVLRLRTFLRIYGKPAEKEAVVLSCLLGAVFLNMMVEPVLEANPYYVQSSLMFLGAMEGTLQETEHEKASSGKTGKGGKRRYAMKEREDLDILHLARVLLHCRWGILLGAVFSAAAVLLGTVLLVTPKYQSTVMFYANNTVKTPEGKATSMSNSDLVTSRGLVDSYIAILYTGESLEEIALHCGVTYTCETLKTMLQAEPVEDTELFRVVAASPDAAEAKAIADAVAQVLPERISGILEGTSAQVVDPARQAEQPAAPDYLQNTLMGFLSGLLLWAAAAMGKELLDGKIRSREDILQSCAYPVLAEIPFSPGKRADTVAAHGYRLLGIKITHLFSSGNCPVLGITSPMPGAEKSRTAVALARELSEMGERVLLVECGLPRASDAGRFLKGGRYPVPAERIWQENGKRFPAGKLNALLRDARQRYDYILLELPALEQNWDVLSTAGGVDGFLLTVCQHQCGRNVLADTVKQLEFVDANILGTVFHCRQPKALTAGRYLPRRGRPQ